MRRNKETLGKAKSFNCLSALNLCRQKGTLSPADSGQTQEQKTKMNFILDLNDRELPEAVERKDWHQSLRIIHRIEANLSEEHLGRGKKDYHLYLSVVLNNKAFILNQLEKEAEAASTMKKALHQLQLAEKYFQSKEQIVAIESLIIKMGLKYCAILSHSECHNEAIQYATTIVQKIGQCLIELSQACRYCLEGPISTPNTVATSNESREKGEKVNFKSIVLKEASKLLMRIEELPPPQILVGKLKGYFQQKMKNMYFWKDNEDNNVKNITKELFKKETQTNERTLLGLQKSSFLVEEFSLSQIMSMDLMKLKLKINTDLYFLLSCPKIIELVLLASVTYFMIATETRFRRGTLDVSKMKITQKYQKLKEQSLAESKILHLKAIELAGQHLPPENQFFLHLINSFNKNYKCILDQIKEESQIEKRSRLHSSSKGMPSKGVKLKSKPLLRGQESRKERPKQQETDDSNKLSQNYEQSLKHSDNKRQRSQSGYRRMYSEPQLI